MNINFIKYHKLNYLFFGILVVATIACLIIFGLNLGIDFLGGTLWEINFSVQDEFELVEQVRPNNEIIQNALNSFNLGEIVIQPTDNNGIILRFKDVDENTHQAMLTKLNEISIVKEKRFESIGPTIGKELKEKTIALIIISLIVLLIYIAISFRKLKWPIASWQYGIVSIITLALDVLVTLLVLILLGKFYNVQLNIAIVAALLTIIGYTINDKVIVFDRVRENILKERMGSFSETVNKSLNQILGRSLSTGACTLIILFVLFFLGGETLKYFSLTLIIGIIVGTYTSLFVASSILVSWGLRGKG
ncbi:MAG TPA: protein translocase subunit SecF [Candidatus Portnoybacteria bacterium]|jgi:preprotein translocase subunit SecF|nr:protein translocase subunit SecF [Candidatus Portnoybacteria bacterium]MDD5752054.1 protein translocase subunit SecF [Candidatus Portnoybacteria bacterium]HOZ16404.1 protein translocase subunit SecF [Candidatus Portnoybacteria bacterium]HPH52046.1 protein translocase subunit SecF [Candidatus Portnoybacteria bacterium]HPJ80195.1 protein translocase subunit SecF [Candidatus Portnoybacteria bacterium]